MVVSYVKKWTSNFSGIPVYGNKKPPKATVDHVFDSYHVDIEEEFRMSPINSDRISIASLAPNTRTVPWKSPSHTGKRQDKQK